MKRLAKEVRSFDRADGQFVPVGLVLAGSLIQFVDLSQRTKLTDSASGESIHLVKVEICPFIEFDGVRVSAGTIYYRYVAVEEIQDSIIVE